MEMSYRFKIYFFLIFHRSTGGSSDYPSDHRNIRDLNAIGLLRGAYAWMALCIDF